MKNVYLLKNNLTKTYSDPIFRFEPPEDMFRHHHDFLLLDPVSAQKQYLHISTIIWIGTYSDETGIITLHKLEDRREYDLSESWKQFQALKEGVTA